MSGAEGKRDETASLEASDGKIQISGSIHQSGHVYGVQNGGLGEVAFLLATVAASGVVGNAAYDAVKLGLRSLRLRLSWGNEGDHRAYVAHIAQLSVAAKLDKPCSVEVASCTREREHWSAVVLAGGRTYRVQVPLQDPRPTTISVDLD
ncbi:MULTISPECIES: hypothetical protein [unclassified Micromonospora]|uniref:hypothetical protein n=1 Tax=unclassified Micromonospora TaxID=2617518 RepID=UPI00362F7AC7